MKKLIHAFLALSMVLFTMQSCEKQDKSIAENASQETYSLGAELLSPAEYQALPKAQLPSILKTDVTAHTLSYLPPVGNQGGEGSCVAFGTTYAARSIDWAYKNSQTSFSYSTNIFSPEYVYNQVKVPGSCGSGAYVYKGLNLLVSQGVCRWFVMPYTDAACKTKPNTTQKADAAGYKISSYGTVPINVDALKNLLVANKPVIVAGPVSSAFMNFGPNSAPLTNRVGSLGGHCYCLVGYDNAKNAFKFMNSWGTGWGESGFGWIDYGYIGQWWTEAYTITTL
jgi:C1A family cysteine protease